MKRYIGMLLMVTMILGLLAGCADQPQETEPTIPAFVAEHAQGNPFQEVSDAVKIGMIGDLSAEGAARAVAAKVGAEIAVEEVNALGNVQLALNFLDDAGQAEQTHSAYHSLEEWGMHLFAGTITQEAFQEVATECSNDRIFILTPSADTEALPQPSDSLFRLSLQDEAEGAAAADYIGAHLADCAIGILYDAADAHSAAMQQGFSDRAGQLGLNVVYSEAIAVDSRSKLSNQVKKCQEAGAELLFLPIEGNEIAQVLTAAGKAGYAPSFVGCAQLEEILAAKDFDPTLAEGMTLLQSFCAAAQDEMTQAFVAKYTQRTGTAPDRFAAQGYDLVRAMYQAMLNGGVTVEMSSEEICDIMIQQFTTMAFNGLTGEFMTWDETGAVSTSLTAAVVENGTLVCLE